MKQVDTLCPKVGLPRIGDVEASDEISADKIEINGLEVKSLELTLADYKYIRFGDCRFDKLVASNAKSHSSSIVRCVFLILTSLACSYPTVF